MGAYVDGDISSLTTSITTLTGVTWPTHTGDHLAILAHGYGDGTNTGTMDAGFTNIADLTDTNLRAVVGKLIPASMTGSESGDVTLTTTTGARQVGALAVYSGYTDVQQIVNQPETSGTAVTTHASPAITPQVNGSGFVIIYMDRVSAGNTTATPPTGFTLRKEFGAVGTGGIFVHVADDLSGTHGLTPFTPDSWTVSVGSTSAVVILIELTPPPVTGTVAVTQADGTSSASGILGYTGTVASTQAGHTSAASGVLGYTGTVARTQAAQTPTASGTFTALPVQQSLGYDPKNPFQIQIWTNAYPYEKVGEVGSYTLAEFTLRHNAVGSWKIQLSPSDQSVLELARADRRITVDYRGVRVMSGEVHGIRRARDERKITNEVYGFDDKRWLERRLGYPNPTATFPADGTSFTQSTLQDTFTGSGETVIKSWVNRNAITRLPIAGLVVNASLGRGSTKTDGVRWETLLEACARVANATGLGLSMVQSGDHLVFDVYEPTERPVRLSENLGNLRSWEYVLEAPIATRLVVGMDGEGLARKYLRERLTTSETYWLVTEKFEDATEATNDTLASEKAYALLLGYAAQAGFSITPVDTQSMAYAEHYNLGDKVMVEVAQDTFLPDIVAQVVLSHSAGSAPRVTPTVGNADSSNKSTAFARRYLGLVARILRQERSR